MRMRRRRRGGRRGRRRGGWGGRGGGGGGGGCIYREWKSAIDFATAVLLKFVLVTDPISHICLDLNVKTGKL